MTDFDVIAFLTQSGAIKDGHFLLASGRHSDRYIEKFDMLRQPAVTTRVLQEAKRLVDPLHPDIIVGPTTGGVILAFDLARQLGVDAAYAERKDEGGDQRTFKRGTTFAPGVNVVVIDDILTTGGSIRETLTALEPHQVHVSGIVVLVDRSGGAVQFGDIPLIPLAEMDVTTWSSAECPLCLQGEPLVKPGSTSVG